MAFFVAGPRSSPDRWFAAPPAPDSAAILMFCLHHAGGGALTYARWQAYLPIEVSVQPIRLPGRENRITEAAEFSIDELAEAIATRVDRPYLLYGHSMGGVLATCLAQRLPPALAVCVGASAPPMHGRDWLNRWCAAADADLLTELVALGAVPDLALRSHVLAERILRPLRADLTWLAGQQATPVRLPLLAIAGRADPLAGPDVMRHWRDAAFDEFRMDIVEGGHLFHLERPPAPLTATLCRLIHTPQHFLSALGEAETAGDHAPYTANSRDQEWTE